MIKMLPILFLFIISHASYSQTEQRSREFDWNDKYIIQVELKESQLASFMSSIDITVQEKTSNNIVLELQEDGMAPDFFIKTIGSQKIFFYSTHSGGESGGTTILKYLTIRDGKVLNETLDESPASFEFIDVDQNGTEEIITKDTRFQWFEVEKDCHLIGFYTEYLDSLNYFFPKIFEFQEDQFIETTFKFKNYLTNKYLLPLEKTLTENEPEKNHIVGFIQYFYVSSQFNLTDHALIFIKKHNKPFQYYHCQNSKTVETTVLDFIKKYQNQILITEESNI